MSTIKRLHERESKIEHELFLVNSIRDKEFTLVFKDLSLAERLRNAAPYISIREDNIKLGGLNATEKEIHILIKSGREDKIIEFLHCLDDYSLNSASKNVIIRRIIDSHISLSQRYKLICDDTLSPAKSTFCFRDISPIPFSLDNEMIHVTEIRDETVDPQTHDQDVASNETGSVILSPKFTRRNTEGNSVINEEIDSPYKLTRVTRSSFLA